jgi:hypothetical protein
MPIKRSTPAQGKRPAQTTTAGSGLKRNDVQPQASITQPSKAVVPANHQSSGMNMPAISPELMAAYEEDAQENLDNVNDAFYRIGIRGARFKVADQVIGNEGVSFEAIILREVPVNTYFSSKYDEGNPTNPDCWSLGGLVPDAAIEHKESASCIACPKNKFGTGTDESGKRSKGKACRNSRRIILKVEGVDLPAIMSLPPTCIKGLNQYLKMLSSNKPAIPMFAVKTLFTFDTTAQYPKPKMSFKELLPADEYLEVREYRLSAEVEGALSAFASPEDVAPDGEESEQHAQDRMETQEGF